VYSDISRAAFYLSLDDSLAWKSAFAIPFPSYKGGAARLLVTVVIAAGTVCLFSASGMFNFERFTLRCRLDKWGSCGVSALLGLHCKSRMRCLHMEKSDRQCREGKAVQRRLAFSCILTLCIFWRPSNACHLAKLFLWPSAFELVLRVYFSVPKGCTFDTVS
jgi:hypothetical protein